jgi:hypothetical protein
MGCLALGVWVAFLKQPALPGEAPQIKKILKKFYKNKNQTGFLSGSFFSWSNFKVTQTPNV